MLPGATTTVGFRIAKTRAPKKAVMKASVPRKERPRRLMLNGANIDNCLLTKPIVRPIGLVFGELFSRSLDFRRFPRVVEARFPSQPRPDPAWTIGNLF